MWTSELLIPPPRQSREIERLDEPAVYAGELQDSMADVRKVNRWLGGTHIALDWLRSQPEVRPGSSISLLDVGTGTADVPLALMGWSRQAGIDLVITATDISPEVLALARAHIGAAGIRLEQADATRLPYPDESFDYVMCNLTLHHFDPDTAVRVLREMNRVAGRGILVNDLRRSRVGYWAARLVFGVAAVNEASSHDGPLSVLRAYTPDELRSLALRAGLPDFTVRPRPMFRMELTARQQGRS